MSLDQYRQEVAGLWSELHRHQVERSRTLKGCAELCDLKGLQLATVDSLDAALLESGAKGAHRLEEEEEELYTTAKCATLQKANAQLQKDIQRLRDCEAGQVAQLQGALGAAEEIVLSRDNDLRDLQALLLEASKQRIRRSIHRLNELRGGSLRRWHSGLLAVWKHQIFLGVRKVNNRGVHLGALLGCFRSARSRIMHLVALWRRRAHSHATKHKSREAAAQMDHQKANARNVLRRISLQLFDVLLRTAREYTLANLVHAWHLALISCTQR